MQSYKSFKPLSAHLHGPLLLLACTAMLQAELAADPCAEPTISVHTMNCDELAPAPQNPDSPATAALPLPADHVKPRLLVDAPPLWKVEFKGDKEMNNMQFYTVTREDGGPSLLMFHPWFGNGNVNQTPALLGDFAKKIANGLAMLQKDDKDSKPKTDEYKIEEIVGDTFSGSFFEYRIEGADSPIVINEKHTKFLLGENEGLENGELWFGHFSGSKEHWTEALAILKALKKNGEALPDVKVAEANQGEVQPSPGAESFQKELENLRKEREELREEYRKELEKNREENRKDLEKFREELRKEVDEIRKERK